MLRAAKETISLAEQRLLEDDKRQFDSAWQEMLNHATQRVSSLGLGLGEPGSASLCVLGWGWVLLSCLCGWGRRLSSQLANGGLLLLPAGEAGLVLGRTCQG